MNDDSLSHYRRFERFKLFADRIRHELAGDREWCSVLWFYGALHLVAAYLSQKRFSFATDTHYGRRQALRESPELKPIRVLYRELQGMSEEVRYDPDFVFSDAHQEHARSHFTRLVTIMEPKVKRLLKLA